MRGVAALRKQEVARENALMEHLIPTISVIATILLVGLGLASLIRNGQTRLENRLLAVEKETARIGGLLEGLGLTGRTKPPEGG